MTLTANKPRESRFPADRIAVLVACGCFGFACATDSTATTKPRTQVVGPTISLLKEAELPHICRSQVQQVIDAGAGRFLKGLTLEVVKDSKGRFIGYRIEDFFPSDPNRSRFAIRKGDIVQTINGFAVDKPDSFFEAWNGMRVASELSIVLLREGHPFRLRYRISDDPSCS